MNNDRRNLRSNEESKSSLRAVNEEMKYEGGKSEETKSINTAHISDERHRTVKRKAKFEHEGMRIGSALPVTSDKAFLMYRDKMVSPYQSESAQAQNSQTALDIGLPCQQYVRFKSSKRLSVTIASKLPATTFPCTVLANLPVHLEQECFYFETRVRKMNTEKKMTMVGLSSRQTAK